VNCASLSTNVDAARAASKAARAPSPPNCSWIASNSGFLIDMTNWLVSPALAPWAARDCESAASTERVFVQAVSSRRAKSASAATAVCSAANSSCASLADVLPETPVAATSASHDLMNSSGDAFNSWSKTAFSCFICTPRRIGSVSPLRYES